MHDSRKDFPVSTDTESETILLDPEGMTDMADPEAPYGRRVDGTPKVKPGPRGPRNRRDASTPAAPAAPRPARAKKAASSPKARAARATTTDYRAGIAGILQLPSAALAMAGRFNPALMYDAATLAIHTPSIAEAVNDLAQNEPRVAAVLDKILQVGPYGAIIGVMVTIGAQIAVNHKKIPAAAAEAMGAVEPEILMQSLQPQTA